MKRTCKTCALRDDIRKRCWRTTKADCPDNKPACEHWILAPYELTKALLASLEKASEKHPVFLDAWPKAEDSERYLDAAKAWKQRIADKGSRQLHAILYSEVCEFIAEVARGDFDRALEEAGDIMAVLYRALNGDGQKKEEKND